MDPLRLPSSHSRTASFCSMPRRRATSALALVFALSPALVDDARAESVVVRPPEAASATTTFGMRDGFDLIVTPAVKGRDTLVPIPIAFQAIEREGAVGRTVVVDLCLDHACEAHERVKLRTGTAETPAPAVSRTLLVPNGTLTAVDARGAQHQLTDIETHGAHTYIALVGDEPEVFPAATLLGSESAEAGALTAGVAPLVTGRALLDHPALVHAFHVVSIAPGTELPPPLVVELRRFLHAGHTVVGDASLRAAIVDDRDDTVTRAEALDGARPLVRAAREIAPSETLVVVPSGQPLRVGARATLPLGAYDERGGLFLERGARATGHDVVDAVLHERSFLGTPGLGRPSYMTSGVLGISSAGVLVARTVPSSAPLVFIALWALVVVGLVMRHRGRRARRAFIVEGGIVSLVFAVGLLVAAENGADDHREAVVVTSTKHGAAELLVERRVKVERVADTGDRLAIAGDAGSISVAELLGEPVSRPLFVERTPDGGFAIEGQRDVALAVVSFGHARASGTLSLELDDSGAPVRVKNTTSLAFDDVRVMRPGEVFYASRVAPSSTAPLTRDGADAEEVGGDRTRAALVRLMSDVSNRHYVGGVASGARAVIVGVGASARGLYALEVLP